MPGWAGEENRRGWAFRNETRVPVLPGGLD